MKIFNKVLLFLWLFVGMLMNAKELPPPSPPETAYGVGPGGPKPPSPIDIYEHFLIAVGIFLIIYFAMKYRKRLI